MYRLGLKYRQELKAQWNISKLKWQNWHGNCNRDNYFGVYNYADPEDGEDVLGELDLAWQIAHWQTTLKEINVVLARAAYKGIKL
jgi:hypothetical protein